MLKNVCGMFRTNKSSETTSSPKKSRIREDVNTDNKYNELKVDDSSIILQRIKQLHCEQLMTDVTLIIEGRDYPAHRLILCASSDVFQVMLMRPEWTEWNESRIILQEPQQCVPVFPLFLAYFYSGQIILNHDNVLPILTLADKYNVKNLSNTCISYMCSNIANAAAHNQLISWLQYTLACGHISVSKSCQNFVKWNFESISKTDDFANFDSDVFISLLQQNDLVVENEMILYNCTVKWLNHQIDHIRQDVDSELNINAQIKTLTEQVMKNVRFPMMSPGQLAKLLLSPLINKYKEFFVERMAIGMIYHSGQEERIQEICNEENGRLLFTPRLYTADEFCSSIIIDNFSSLPCWEPRGLIFSSHINLAEYKDECSCDWNVDLYPKGVWFKKFYLIVWQGTVEVPEYILPTVRLSITCKDIETHRVRINILLYGEKSSIEHIVNVVERIYTFSHEDRLLNIDDIIPFNYINPPITDETATKEPNLYLIGEERNTLKMQIVITPLNEYCSNYNPSFILK